MKKASLRAHFFIQMLRKAHFGCVEIEFPDGKKELFGEGAPLIRVQVRRWEVFDLLFSKGDLGLAKTTFVSLFTRMVNLPLSQSK